MIDQRPRTSSSTTREKQRGVVEILGPDTEEGVDPEASIRFAGVGCARAAMVGEESVKSGDAVRCSEADGDDGGVFPSLAAHPY